MIEGIGVEVDMSPDQLSERRAIVGYLRRQAEGCERRALELEELGELETGRAQRALARTLAVLGDRIAAGAHRAGQDLSYM